MSTATHFCHLCKEYVSPTENITCPLCGEDFIEIRVSNLNESWNDYSEEDDEYDDYADMFQFGVPYGRGGMEVMDQEINIHSAINNILNASLGVNLADIGIHGNIADYGVGQNLEDILHQTFEQQPITGPPPASKKVVEKLKNIVIAQKHIDASTDCAVCKERFLEREECKV